MRARSPRQNSGSTEIAALPDGMPALVPRSGELPWLCAHGLPLGSAVATVRFEIHGGSGIPVHARGTRDGANSREIANVVPTNATIARLAACAPRRGRYPARAGHAEG